MKKVLLGGIAVLIILVLAGVVLVRAVNAAAPGDLLYPVDREMENLSMGMINSPQQALELQIRIASERLDELEEVVNRGDVENFEGAIYALRAAVAAVENISTAEDTSAELVGAVLDRTLAGSDASALDDNGNTNDNSNENSNANSNENANDNSNDNDNANTNENTNEAYKHPRTGGRCGGAAHTTQPAAEKIAGEFGVGADEIMDWFCGGYGLGEISLAYDISRQTGVSVVDIFTQRAGGMGWGQIMQSYGLIGKGAKKGGSAQPAGNPPANSGLGSGNGNGSNGHGNANGHGNGQGHGNGKNKGKKH